MTADRAHTTKTITIACPLCDGRDFYVDTFSRLKVCICEMGRVEVLGNDAGTAPHTLSTGGELLGGPADVEARV